MTSSRADAKLAVQHGWAPVRLTVALIGITAALALVATSARAAVTIESFRAETASAHPIAGAHEDATTAFAFKRIFDPEHTRLAPLGGNPKEIAVRLPPGLVADLQNVPTCPRRLFAFNAIIATPTPGGCPANSMVGTATVLVAPTSPGVPVQELTLGV